VLMASLVFIFRVVMRLRPAEVVVTQAD
jgi:hypothetical protein